MSGVFFADVVNNLRSAGRHILDARDLFRNRVLLRRVNGRLYLRGSTAELENLLGDSADFITWDEVLHFENVNNPAALDQPLDEIELNEIENIVEGAAADPYFAPATATGPSLLGAGSAALPGTAPIAAAVGTAVVATGVGLLSGLTSDSDTTHVSDTQTTHVSDTQTTHVSDTQTTHVSDTVSSGDTHVSPTLSIDSEHNYLGPGNTVNSGAAPIDVDDDIALEHDQAYERAQSQADIQEADRQSANEFLTDAIHNLNPHSVAGYIGLAGKRRVEQVIGVQYPPNLPPTGKPWVDANILHDVILMRILTLLDSPLHKNAMSGISGIKIECLKV